MVKKFYYYIPVLVNEDGNIFVDYSSRNKDNKIIFHRIPANEIVYDKKNQDWNIKNEVKKIGFYLQKNGMVISDSPVEMVQSLTGLAKGAKEYDYYYFVIPKRVSTSRINENLVEMEFEDFLADEDIHWSEKLAVTFFYNGDSIQKWM